MFSSYFPGDVWVAYPGVIVCVQAGSGRIWNFSGGTRLRPAGSAKERERKPAALITSDDFHFGGNCCIHYLENHLPRGAVPRRARSLKPPARPRCWKEREASSSQRRIATMTHTSRPGLRRGLPLRKLGRDAPGLCGIDASSRTWRDAASRLSIDRWGKCEACPRPPRAGAPDNFPPSGSSLRRKTPGTMAQSPSALLSQTRSCPEVPWFHSCGKLRQLVLKRQRPKTERARRREQYASS